MMAVNGPITRDALGTVRKEIHNGEKDANGYYEEEGGWSLWILVGRARYNLNKSEVWTDFYWMCYDSSAPGNPGCMFPIGSAIETNPIVGRVVIDD